MGKVVKSLRVYGLFWWGRWYFTRKINVELIVIVGHYMLKSKDYCTLPQILPGLAVIYWVMLKMSHDYSEFYGKFSENILFLCILTTALK